MNEILPSGDVVHLTQQKPPKNPTKERLHEDWRNPSRAAQQQAPGNNSSLINTGYDGTNESKVGNENVVASSAKDPGDNVISRNAGLPIPTKREARDPTINVEEASNGGTDSAKVGSDLSVAQGQSTHKNEQSYVKSENIPPIVESRDANAQAATVNDKSANTKQEPAAHREASGDTGASESSIKEKRADDLKTLNSKDKAAETSNKQEGNAAITKVPPTKTAQQTSAAKIINQDGVDSSNDPFAHHFQSPPQKAAELSKQSSPIREDVKAREQTGHTRFKAHVRLVNGEWKELTEEEEAQLKAQQEAERAEKKANGGDQATISKGVVHGENSMPAPRANGIAMWNAYAGVNKEERLDVSIHSMLDTRKHDVDSPQWSQEDQSTLEGYFSREVVDNLRSLYNRILQSPDQPPKKYGSVKSPRISREARKQIHADLRRIFHDKLESETDADGCITITATPRQPSFPGRQQQDSRGQQGNRNGQNKKPALKGKQVWEDRGGEYLHFTLYKENKDTMECISWLMKQLKNKPRDFHFAGTKDRRAVTTQRVCVYRIYLDKLISAGRTLRNATLGNFEYKQDKLQLGDLAGNEFVITLRNCQFEGLDAKAQGIDKATASKVIANSVESLNRDGFINYYGLQRFGTFAWSTDAIGIALLRGDFNGAVNGILSFNPACLETEAEDTPPSETISRDDRARAQGIHHFMQTGDLNRAIDRIPRKFSAETTIIRHLSHPGHQNDFLGALKMIQRNHRLMYVHAYQSLVWNHAASERWRLYGNSVVEGDLVIIKKEDQEASSANPGVDADGEVVVQAAEDDRAVELDDIFTRARPLSQPETESGKYSIFDIVLPTPGFDVVYPSNEIGTFYTSFMAGERGGGLDPNDMRRPYKDFSLSGSYRNLIALPLKPVTFELRSYVHEDEQFVETDLERLRSATPRKGGSKPLGHAVPEVEEPVRPPRGEGGDASKRPVISSEAYTPLTTGGVSLNPTATSFAPVTDQVQSTPLVSGGVDISKHPHAQGTGTNRSSPRIEQGERQQDDEGGGEVGSGVEGGMVVEKQEKEKIAVIVRMQLGSSTYATMALREVMRGGVRNWKGELGGGR